MAYWSHWKKPNWRHYILIFLLLLLAGNYLARYYLQQRERERNITVTVRVEKNTFAGHNSLGIDENNFSATAYFFLRFTTLGQWQFDPGKANQCPPEIRSLNGREVSCLGFMYPLEPGSAIKTFCLLRTTQTCCYGPRPQWNQYLLVELKKTVKFERFAPVIVRGSFFVDPQPSQGFIYRLEGVEVTAVDDAEAELDPVIAAQNARLPLFDFTLLDRVKIERKIPPELQQLDGRKVMASGYFLERSESIPPQLLLGSVGWDGLTVNKRPNIYNAILVLPRESGQIPPLWKENGIFTGTLRIEPDSAKWAENGIAVLHNAVRGFGGGYDYRWWSWLLSPLTGWIVLLFFLAFAVRKSQANGESQ